MERRTCSECSPKLQRHRGCHRPPSAAPPAGYRDGAAMRFTSPLLMDFVIYECPVGFVLREAPWAYDAIEATGTAENCGPREWAQLPLWYKHCVRLVRSERERLRERQNENRAAQRASGNRLRG